jgi:hypothetical protein
MVISSLEPASNESMPTSPLVIDNAPLIKSSLSSGRFAPDFKAYAHCIRSNMLSWRIEQGLCRHSASRLRLVDGNRISDPRVGDTKGTCMCFNQPSSICWDTNSSACLNASFNESVLEKTTLGSNRNQWLSMVWLNNRVNSE